MCELGLPRTGSPSVAATHPSLLPDAIPSSPLFPLPETPALGEVSGAPDTAGGGRFQVAAAERPTVSLGPPGCASGKERARAEERDPRPRGRASLGRAAPGGGAGQLRLAPGTRPSAARGGTVLPGYPGERRAASPRATGEFPVALENLVRRPPAFRASSAEFSRLRWGGGISPCPFGSRTP